MGSFGYGEREREMLCEDGYVDFEWGEGEDRFVDAGVSTFFSRPSSDAIKA